jgi:HlyD family secretion protein
VFIVVDGKVKMKFVKTGIQDNMSIQILEGLTADDKVVTSPFRAISKTLKEGDVVKVVQKEELFVTEE